jgi:hypothetical protein
MYNYFRLYYFFIAIFTTTCFCTAQSKVEIKLNGTYKNISTIQLIRQIEKDYPIKFYYRQEWFKPDTISISFNNETIASSIEKILNQIPYTAEFVDDSSIVILPKPDVDLIMGQNSSLNKKDDGAKTIGDIRETGKYSKVTIKGKIIDGKLGEVIIGAVVMVENTQIASVTDKSGNYSLYYAPGQYTLVVTSVGYEKAKQKIKLISNGNLDIELYTKSVNLNEIYVYAKRADRNVRSTQMSIVELDAKGIKQMPSLTGEKDILRSFTMMPGVKSVGEFGSGINVRGGGEDQNLYLIEGSPLFNTSHVFGLISVINPDAVNNVTLYKGHIPASFGERVSSVMDIQIKNNNGGHWKTSGGIGLFNSQTLYWAPNCEADEKGAITIEFYTSLIKTKYKINIQGVTSDKMPVSTTIDFEVK